MARDMTDDERRAFLLEGTRTGKVAWVSPKGNVHVAPIWFVLDGDDVLFTTHEDSAKGKAFTRRHPGLDGRRRPGAAVLVREGRRHRQRSTATSTTCVEVATRIGGRYMGEDRAEEFGRRNGVPGELVVRIRRPSSPPWPTSRD